MNKILIGIFIIFCKSAIGQNYSYCDSIQKCFTTANNMRNNPHNQLKSGINITIDNSHNSNKVNESNNEPVSKFVSKCSCQCKENCDYKKKTSVSFLEDSFNQLKKNFFSLILAFIAGCVALIQVKSNVIASSRIKWNDELKKTLSEYYTEVINTAYYFSSFLETKNNDEHKLYLAALTRYNALGNNIRMQLNSFEDEHRRIELILDKIDKVFDNLDNKMIDISNIENELREIVSLSKIIFKKEWKKAKKWYTI